MDKEAAKTEIKRLVDKYNNVVAGGKLKDYKEENTKKDFITPLFRALDWDMENDKSLDEVSNEDQISKGRVDYAFRLNSIVKFYLEAKALNKGLDEAKDAAQAISYAWNKGTTWAVLTDFKTLAIYNADVRSSLLESQFLRLDCNQYVEHFEDLLLLSKPSFQENEIDKKAETWSKKRKKTKVGDQLLTELMAYRQLLSKNIVKNNAAKNLNEADLDEAVQKIIDRLIFIRTTEDREIDPRNLLTMAREFEGGKHGKLRDNLNTLYKIYDRNYNSKLFTYDPNDLEKRHLCETLEVDNEVLITVINGLYKSKDGLTEYDFSAIDADVLGNIYEQYLSHILRKTAKRASVESKEAHRKEQGIYYTPTYIVDYIVRNTLSEVLKGKKPEEAEKIRVLDMACGSGSFLLKSFDIFNEYYKANDKNYAQTSLDAKSDAEKITRKTKILKNNIFGVDLDPKAVEIAQLNLLLKAAETKHRLPDLRENIKCGNSLIDQSLSDETRAFDWHKEFHKIIDEEKGFDVIVGNPPYISAIQLTKDVGEGTKKYWKDKYKSASGAYDIYVLFFEQAMKVVKPDGYVGFITPNKYLSSPYGIALREYLASNYKLVAIVDLSSVKVFDDPSVYPVITIIQKKKEERDYKILIKRPKNEDLYSAQKLYVSSKWLTKLPENIWGWILSENISLVEKIFTDSKTLESISKVQATTTAAEADLYSQFISEEKGTPIINTGLIDRFSTTWGHTSFSNKGTKLKTPKLDVSRKEISNGRRELYSKSKIIFAKLALRPEGFFDKNGKYASINTNCIHSPKDGISLEFLSCLMNSKLMAFAYASLFSGLRMGGGYYQFQSPQLRILPVKLPNIEQESIFKNYLNRMLDLQEKFIRMEGKQIDEKVKLEKEIAEIDVKIDQLVYDLYGLTDEERKIVEKAVVG